MAMIGVQYASKADADSDSNSDTGAGISKLSSFFTTPRPDQQSSNSPPAPIPTPAFSELASVTDNRGFFNLAVLAYWPSRAAYDGWAAASGFDAWWAALSPEEETDGRQRGWFREVFFPTMDRLETVFTDREVPEGAGHLREDISGLVREHAYWGSMRDRLPIAQVDALVGEKGEKGERREKSGTLSSDSTAEADKRCGRVRVPGKRNLTVIRSGQDWSNTRPEERKLYLETMHPALIRGMDFLRDHGDEVGCHSCRLMDIVIGGPPSEDEAPDAREKKVVAGGTDRTFGLAYFDELASLEGWSREHQTHLDIFGGFFRYARSLDNDITLRLFHEVLVLEPEQQLFEYIGCHGGTGMLATLR